MLHLRPFRHRTLVAVAVLVACGGGSKDDDKPAMPATPVIVGDTIAVTASSRVVLFNHTAPATLSGNVSMPGLLAGETLVEIDVRPADRPI